MASEASIHQLIGHWAGQTTSYFPEDTYNTIWQDTKIILTTSTLSQNQCLFFGKGKSEWRDNSYYFTLKGSINTNSKKISFVKTHHCRESLENYELKYTGILLPDGTIEARWDGGQLSLVRQRPLEDLEIEFLKIGELFQGSFKDKNYSLQFEKLYLDFNSRGLPDEVRMEGLAFIQQAFIQQGQPQHLEFTGSLRKEEGRKIIGEMDCNPGTSKNMKVFYKSLQIASDANYTNEYELVFVPQLKWTYLGSQMGDLIEQVTEPSSPPSCHMPAKKLELSTTPSKRAFIPPNIIIEFVKQVIRKEKNGDYEVLARKKEKRRQQKLNKQKKNAQRERRKKDK